MRLITFNPHFAPRWQYNADVHLTPSVNIVEKNNGYYVDVVSPGWKKEDFKVELTKNQLTISATQDASTSTTETEKVWQNEYSLHSFTRSFHLPTTVEADAIEAHYENGILKLYIPKKAEVIPAVKTIEIA